MSWCSSCGGSCVVEVLLSTSLTSSSVLVVVMLSMIVVLKVLVAAPVLEVGVIGVSSRGGRVCARASGSCSVGGGNGGCVFWLFL